MEQNYNTARKISLSIWITQLVAVIFVSIWFVIIFFSIFSRILDLEDFDIVSDMIALAKGPLIITISADFILLSLLTWLFTINKNFTDGKVKKHIFITLILYFVATSYDMLISTLLLFGVQMYFIALFNMVFGTIGLAAWIMMIMSWNYLKDFERNNLNVPRPAIQQPKPQWNPNSQFPGQQQNNWSQQPQQGTNQTNDAITKIEQASKLKEKGLITEEEFQKIKKDALSKI